MIANNTAKSAAHYSGDGRYMTKSLYEILNHELEKQEQSGQEIVDDLTRRMGLEVKNNGTV